MSTRRSIDLGSLGAIPIGIGLILIGQALEGGSIHSLFQSTAALIVFGGTAAALFLSFSPADVRRAFRDLRRVLFDTTIAVPATIDAIGRYAVRARRQGIIALDADLDQITDPFLRKGLTLAVDGVNPQLTRDMLEVDSHRREEEDLVSARIFDSAGGYSPTFGILGAVLGLIHVMENLSDPDKLGSGIAVAFVATVYGVGAANMLFLPIATKLRARARRAAHQREVVVEGIIAIQEGLNPRIIEQKLRNFAGEEALAGTVVGKGQAA